MTASGKMARASQRQQLARIAPRDPRSVECPDCALINELNPVSLFYTRVFIR